MERKYAAYLSFAVVTIWAIPVFSGDYVTYKDPKTGAIYFGDYVPPDAAKSAAVEIKAHKPVSSLGDSRNFVDAVRGTTPVVHSAPKPVMHSAPKQKESGGGPPPADYQAYQAMMGGYFDPPTPPSRDKTAREFNRRTNQQGQYEQKMFEYRMKRYDAGYRSLP